MSAKIKRTPPAELPLHLVLRDINRALKTLAAEVRTIKKNTYDRPASLTRGTLRWSELKLCEIAEMFEQMKKRITSHDTA